MARKPEEVEAAIELARAAGVSEALLERMGGYTGCVGVLDTGRPGPVTTLRFDIDCLAIEETKDENHLPNREGFASTRPGLSHACGHDGHTAVGLGVAQWLADNKETLCGKVKLVFQPAEEGVRGAAAIAASGVLDDVDWFTAGHIGCDAKPGQVGVSHEGYLATTKFDLEIFGLPCAAGSPEKGHSALMCACNTVMALGSLPGHSKGITRVQVGKIVSLSSFFPTNRLCPAYLYSGQVCRFALLPTGILVLYELEPRLAPRRNATSARPKRTVSKPQTVLKLSMRLV